MTVEPKLVAERQRNLVLVEFHTVDDVKVVLLDLTQLSHEEKVVQLVRHGRIVCSGSMADMPIDESIMADSDNSLFIFIYILPKFFCLAL